MSTVLVPIVDHTNVPTAARLSAICVSSMTTALDAEWPKGDAISKTGKVHAHVEHRQPAPRTTN
jgi:hypothetical protein